MLLEQTLFHQQVQQQYEAKQFQQESNPRNHGQENQKDNIGYCICTKGKWRIKRRHDGFDNE